MDIPIPDIRIAETPFSEAALCAWLGAASPGDTIVYHRGFLAREISPLTQMLAEPERLALLRLANRAWSLAEGGLAHLVQRRHGNEDYDYMMVARHRPRQVRPALLSTLFAEAT